MADVDHIKAMIRSVLMTASYGVLATKFPKEYEDTTGSVLPLKAMGVKSINDLARLMPDVIKAERNAQGQIVFYVVANEKIAHIAMMKSKEKGKSKKNRRPAGAKKMFFSSEGSAEQADLLPSIINPLLPITVDPLLLNLLHKLPLNLPHLDRYLDQLQTEYNFSERCGNRQSRYPTLSASCESGCASLTVLCGKIRSLMSEFNWGLSESVHGCVATKNEIPGKLVSEYETFFKEPAEPNLLELVLQMEGSVLRIERPYGQNSNKLILYGIEDDPETLLPVSVTTVATNGTSPGRPNIKYPEHCGVRTGMVHAPLPWLGVRADCYVTLAHSPSYFWVQIKSPQLNDLVKITELMQTTCEAAPPEQHGRFYVNELVCGLFEEDQQWYRAIVLDVGTSHDSCLDTLDPALFLPNSPTPQFKWRDAWKVKLFFVDYGNIEWVTLDRIRRKKFPYPNGQAFRCSLGSITPKEEWSKEICDVFKNITENRDCESLQMTVEAVKSEKAHYGFKSRLNEWCQKRKHEFATFTKPLNSDCGWRTSCTIKHPTKGYKTYQGFYQNKKNDAEASAAQLVIRDWDITLLDSKDIPAHWIEVILENKDTDEAYNKSLVESGVAIPNTSIYDICIPKQPDLSEIPTLKSEMAVSYKVEDSSDEESMSSEEEEPSYSPAQVEPDDVELPEIGDLVYMYITHVQSPKNICMRNIDGDNDNILTDMEDELTIYVNDAGTPLTSVQVDTLCAVLSEKYYYRAKVLRLLKNNRAEVLMLDYGDTQMYRIDELYHLDSRFLTLPYQALSCSLYGLEKIIHAESLTDFIRNEIEEHKFTVRIKDIVNERTLSVEIRTDTGDNMNELFLSQDIRNLSPRLPHDGEKHLVKLTDVSPEGVLSLQIDGPGITSLGQLMKELRDHYEEKAAKASDYIVDPQQGQICCSSLLVDGERRWYRTVINRNVSDHSVEVTFVDYGNTQIIPRSKLREPAIAVPNISRLPFQAYPVMLADLPTSPANWTEKEVETLKGYTKDQNQIQAVISEEVAEEAFPLVRIYFGPDEDLKCLNNLLSGDGNLFQTRATLPETEQLGLNLGNLNFANPTFIDPQDIVLDQNSIPKLSLQRQAEALISHVDNPYSWFFQSREFHEQFRIMGEEMNTFYSQPLDCREQLWKTNDMCVAYCDQYQGWYRARVQQVYPDGKVLQCSMVDYGDVQKIPLSSVRPLTKQFAALPIQACRAALCGVMPVDGSTVWSEEAKKFFSAAVSERMLWVKLMAQDPASQILWMHIIDTGHDDTDVYISNSLVEKGLAIHPPPQISS
ncbi:tudor domain-containing protein 7B-like [Bolinopsis microptera]|uniref:tudor domain-containing protein 7B-like n=1 Tax=Bolinopsis microptera TaxID=2820187 RepID=UPI00307A2379